MKVKGREDKPRVLPAEGVHPARCFWIIDLGTQKGEYLGQPKEQHKVYFGFELADSLHVFDEAKGPQPLAVYEEFTMSIDPKSNLGPFIEKWRDKKFTEQEVKDGWDVFQLIGKPLALDIGHRKGKKDPTKTYEFIKDVFSTKAKMDATGKNEVRKKIEVQPQVNASICFELGGENWPETFKKIPGWIQKKISSCVEWPQYASALNAPVDPEVARMQAMAKEEDDF